MAKFYININGELFEIGAGNSAYDIAVYNGYKGTEEEWLNSLRGDKGADGSVITINPLNNHWCIDEKDTGVVAKGEDGNDGTTYTPTIGTVDALEPGSAAQAEVVVDETGKTAAFSFKIPKGDKGDKGDPGAEGLTPTIGENNHWFIGEEDTGVIAEGKDGADGKAGKSIQSITKDDDNNIIVTFTDGTTQNIGQLNIDVQADFLTEDGFGKLRYYNGKFQYYDTSTSTWFDTSVSPENVYVMQMMPQTMQKIIGIYDVKLGKNKLKFEEPNDTVIDGQTACVVDKVVLRRKLGSSLTDETDGDLVAEVPRSQFGLYKNSFFIDFDLTPAIGEEWYYKAFPMSTTGFYNSSSVNEISILCKDYYLYGFAINQNESDPASMITYIEDNKNFASAYMNYTTDTFDYGDWASAFFMKVKPCMLKYDGTVDYYLNPNDYSLKEDGTASDIADDSYEGNVMIQFPKTYWKIVDNGDNTANVYISDSQLDDDYHCWSHIDNNGKEIDYCYMPIYNGYNDGTRLRSLSGKTPIYSQTGTTEISLADANNQTSSIIWHTEVYSDRQLVNLLLLLIGKSTNTQTVFGNGYYTGGSSSSNPHIATGTMNSKGLFWGSNGSSMVGVKVFGMEHWWGNQWRRIAGWINDNGTQKVKMTYGKSDGSTVDGYNTTGSGYITIGNSILSGTTGGYISGMIFSENGLIPKTVSGSATTYYTDGLWFNNSQVDYALVGGPSSGGFLVGALYSYLDCTVSYAGWTFGAAVSCKPLA